MSLQPWDIVFLVGFLAYVVIRGAFERRTKGNEKLVSQKDWREHTVMGIVFVGSLLLCTLFACHGKSK